MEVELKMAKEGEQKCVRKCDKTGMRNLFKLKLHLYGVFV